MNAIAPGLFGIKFDWFVFSFLIQLEIEVLLLLREKTNKLWHKFHYDALHRTKKNTMILMRYKSDYLSQYRSKHEKKK
jgi:hypothetical protein